MNSGGLAVAIGLIALLYASVGHAGATGYIAVMTLAGLEPGVIRPTALALNVVVAVIATVEFARAGHSRRDLLLPLAAASVPCAAVGGAIRLPLAVFEGVLGGVLLAGAARLVVRPRAESARRPEWLGRPASRAAVLAPLGAVVGLLSGLTGVGGGVFLSPVLLALDAAGVRQVAAVTAPFILVNSLAGLAGGLAAGGGLPPVSLPVVAAAVLGGLCGARLGAFRLPAAAIRVALAGVLAVAGLKLLGGAVAAARPRRAAQCATALENRLSTMTPATIRAMPRTAAASSFSPRNSQPIAAMSVTPAPDQMA